MTTDRELLEAAAKAFGITLEYRRSSDAHYYDDPETGRELWNPLGRDEQTFRLAVKLHMGVKINDANHWQEPSATIVIWDDNCARRVVVKHKGDPCAATRRAIVRAAASIGGVTHLGERE